MRSLLGRLFLFFHFAVVFTSTADNRCYQAKICIHNNKEKCGLDKHGDKPIYRRFFDTCDMLEYNCLRDTYFVKDILENCAHLPPIPLPKTVGGKPAKLVGDADNINDDTVQLSGKKVKLIGEYIEKDQEDQENV